MPGVFDGQKNLAGYSPWGRKESDTTEQLTHTHTHTHRIETTQKHKVMTRPTKDSLSIQRIVFRLKKKEYME